MIAKKSAAAAAIVIMLAGCTKAPEPVATIGDSAASVYTDADTIAALKNRPTTPPPADVKACSLMRSAGRPNNDLVAGHEASRTLREDYSQQDLNDAVETACPDLADVPPLVAAVNEAHETAIRQEAERDLALAQAVCAAVADPQPATIAQWQAGWIDVSVSTSYLPHPIALTASAPEVRRIIPKHCPGVNLDNLG